MRKRCRSPAVPAQIQRNVIGVALSSQAPVKQLTVAEITTDLPLSKLACFIQHFTISITQESLVKTIEDAAPVRDKSGLVMSCDSFPPMCDSITDWRGADICSADFGFAQPCAFRHPMDFVTPVLMIVYPPRTDDAASDDGPEFIIGIEKELLKGLRDDVEWCKYFEFRGVDWKE